MLKRKMMAVLEAWKERNEGVALCIMGARQTGKTTIAKEFGRTHYQQTIEVNFLLQEDAGKIFEHVDRAEDILRNLSAYTRQRIIPGHTLVLFDEVEACPAARTHIKTLVLDGRCDYIETGSMLGVRFREVRSYPVGFEQIMRMYPLDFEEFLWAHQIPEATISYIQQAFRNETEVSASIHDTLIKLFRTYMVVGGMPKVVQAFIDSGDISEVTHIQHDLLALYRQDIAQYAPNTDKPKIRDVLDQIPSQLNAKNNRFKLSHIAKNARSIHFESSFLWLSEAGVALPCYNCTAPVIPLDLNLKRNLFKLYFCDTGLLCAMSLDEIQFDVLQGNVQINHGSLLENVFAQSLTSNRFPLYYFDSKKIGELDFVIQNRQKITTLEIKSGNDFTKHPSLDRALANPEWKIEEGIVFCKGNVRRQGNVLYLPFYMVFLLEHAHTEKPALLKTNFSDLLPPK